VQMNRYISEKVQMVTPISEFAGFPSNTTALVFRPPGTIYPHTFK